MTEGNSRNPNARIDDLGFRVSWMETTLQSNIKRLKALADRNLATADVLRQEISALVEDTIKELQELQVIAVERLLVVQRAGGDVIAFPASPSSEKLPRVELVSS